MQTHWSRRHRSQIRGETFNGRLWGVCLWRSGGFADGRIAFGLPGGDRVFDPSGAIDIRSRVGLAARFVTVGMQFSGPLSSL